MSQPPRTLLQAWKNRKRMSSHRRNRHRRLIVEDIQRRTREFLSSLGGAFQQKTMSRRWRPLASGMEMLEDRSLLAATLVNTNFNGGIPPNVEDYGSAHHQQSWVELTPAINGQRGSIVVDGHGVRATSFLARFNQSIKHSTSAAPGDGISFAYGQVPDVAFGNSGPGQWDGQSGPTKHGLVIKFDTYNGSASNAGNIEVWYNKSLKKRWPNLPTENWDGQFSLISSLRGSWHFTEISITNGGLLTLYHPAIGERQVSINGWDPQANWRFGLGASTGGANDAHIIEDLYIRDLSTLSAPSVTYVGHSGTRLDSARGTFSWNISDVNGDLNSATITLQKETSPGSWTNVRSSSWSLSTIYSDNAVTRSLPLTTSDLANHGVGKYRAFISATDKSSRTKTQTSPVMTIVDDDSSGPRITLTDHLGQSLLDTEMVYSHGGAPSIDWSISDFQIVDGQASDSGISSSQIVVTRDGQPYFSSTDSSGSLDLTAVGPGLYEVIVSTSDNDRDHGSQSASDFSTSVAGGALRLTNDAPILQVGLDRVAVEGQTRRYDVLNSSDEDGDTLNYSWDFGDGSAAQTGATVDHVFAENGAYDVTVTADDGFGGTTADTFTVTVANAAPAILGVSHDPAQIAVGDPVSVVVQADDVAADALTFEADWDGGGVFDAQITTGAFSTSFVSEGLHVANLKVTDDEGAVTTTQAVFQVGAPAAIQPEINFDLPAQTASEADGFVEVHASLSEPSTANIAVPITITGDVVQQDYATPLSFLIIPAGATSGSFAVELLDDVTDEEDEDLIVQMGVPINAVAGTSSSHAVTIEDNDDAPSAWLTTSGRTVAETEQTITVTARLSHPSDKEIQIPVAITGTADSDADFQLLSDPIITFPPGETFGYLDVQVVDDDVPEPAETVILAMQSPNFATLSTDPTVTTTHSLLIQENDAPSVSYSALYAEVNEADGQIVLTAELSASHFQEVTADVAFSGTADEFDIVPLSGVSFVFPVGETTATAALTLNDDSLSEQQEYLVSEIVSTTGGVLTGARSSSVVAINDNDAPKVQFAIRSQTHFEAAVTVPVEITVSPASPEATIVPIRLLSGSASNGTDFDFSVQQVLIPAGVSSVTTSITIFEDSAEESNESVNLSIGQLESSTGGDSIAEVGLNSRHTISIRNDDVEASLLVSQATVTEVDGSVELTVRLSGPSDEAIVATILAHGTAELGDDYSLAGTSSNTITVVIPAGETSATTTIQIHEDATQEVDETIVLNLLSGGVGTTSVPPQRIVILDDDLVSVSFGTPVTQISEGAGQFGIPIHLSAPVEFATTVFVQDPRKSEPDLVVFPENTTEVVYLSDTQNDSGLDVTKHVFFSMGAPLGVTLGSATQHEVVIYDDDRRDGHWGEIEYSAFINKRGYDEWTEATGFADWVDHVSGFDWLFDAVLSVNSSIFCSAIGFSAGLFTTVATGGIGAVGANLGAVAAASACSFIYSDLVTGGEKLQKANRWIVAQVNDGPITDFQAFFDANKNGVADFLDIDGDGVQDAGELTEPVFQTTPGGLLFGEVPIDFDRNGNDQIDTEDGQLVAAGGIDLSTNFEMSIPLSAPWPSGVVTPLTTIASELVNHHGFDAESAVDRVLEAYQLPEFNLLLHDPVLNASDGDTAAAEVFAAGAQTHSTVNQIASFISGIANAPTERIVGQFTYRELASATSDAGSSLDLSNRFVIQAIADSVARQFGLSVDTHVLQSVSEIIAAGNRVTDDLDVEANLNFLESVAQVQIVAQGDVSDWLHQAAQEEVSIEEVLAASTGENLSALVEAAEPGMLLIPEIEIADSTIVEGDFGQQLMEFEVSLINEPVQPVSVRYTTVDVNDALAGHDFEHVHGTLNWEPGDGSSRIIQVPIHGDQTFEGEEQFELWLDDADGAVISRQMGRGVIVEDDPFSYTAPSDGQPNEITISIFDENRVVLTRNGATVLNSPFAPDQPIEIHGATDVQNDFVVSAVAANMLESGAIHVTGGNQHDRLVIRNESATSNNHQIDSASSGTFAFDGNLIEYSAIDEVVDTWTPTLEGASALLLEGAPIELTLDFSQALSRELTTFDWQATSNSTVIAASQSANLTFTPPDDGTFEIAVRIESPGGATVDLSTSLTVANVAPTSAADPAAVDEDGPGASIAVLENDTDPAGANDPLTVTGVDGTGTVGVVGFDSDEVFYDPNAQFESLDEGDTATESFTYSLADGDGGTATGQVTVTIVGQNDDPSAEDDTATTDENTSQSIDVLANDTDVDGDDEPSNFSVDAIDNVSVNGLSIDPLLPPDVVTIVENRISFVPGATFDELAPGETATVTVGYTMSDDSGAVSEATLVLTVHGVSDAPAITELSASHDEPCNSAVDGNVTIDGSFVDVDLTDTHAAIVNWGDGSPSEPLAVDQLADTFAAGHAYATGGIFTVTVIVFDSSGGVSAEVTTTAVVQGVGLVEGVLYVIATEAKDDIDVRRHPQRDELKVDARLAGQGDGSDRLQQTFTASNVSLLVVRACGGDDKVHLGGGEQASNDGEQVVVTSMIFGGAGDDHLVGGQGNNYLDGGDGDDRIQGRQGDDVIHGGEGDNKIDGGHGNDTITAGSGDDDIDGNQGDDMILAGDGRNKIDGGHGDDTITAGSSDDDIDGNQGDDVILAGDGRNKIDAGHGDDIVVGGIADDDIEGGAGRDLLIGGFGQDKVRGNQGDDLLIAHAAANDHAIAALQSALARWTAGDLAAALIDLGPLTPDQDQDHLDGHQGHDELFATASDTLKP